MTWNQCICGLSKELHPPDSLRPWPSHHTCTLKAAAHGKGRTVEDVLHPRVFVLSLGYRSSQPAITAQALAVVAGSGPTPWVGGHDPTWGKTIWTRQCGPPCPWMNWRDSERRSAIWGKREATRGKMIWTRRCGPLILEWTGGILRGD
jgi:hypothetical protein